LDNSADPDITDSHGRTALMYAARNNHVDGIGILLTYDANQNKLSHQDMTYLDYAAEMDIHINEIHRSAQVSKSRRLIFKKWLFRAWEEQLALAEQNKVTVSVKCKDFLLHEEICLLRCKSILKLAR